MIKIYGVDKKLHGDALTTFLTKREVFYTIDYSQEDFEAGLFNIYIDEEPHRRLKISVGCNSEYLSINAPNYLNGYDIARNEFYKLEVI